MNYYSDFKRYEIFVSSTYKDLKKERSVVMKAILDMGHFPTGMEEFPATDQDQFDYIKRVIDTADYYILIMGGKCGSMYDEEMGICFTRMEYEYAVEKGIPVIAFIKTDENGETLIDCSDGKEEMAYKDFVNAVEKTRMRRAFRIGEELAGLVLHSLSEEIKIHPRYGWIRDYKPDYNGNKLLLRGRLLHYFCMDRQIYEREPIMKKVDLSCVDVKVCCGPGSQGVFVISCSSCDNIGHNFFYDIDTDEIDCFDEEGYLKEEYRIQLSFAKMGNKEEPLLFFSVGDAQINMITKVYRIGRFDFKMIGAITGQEYMIVDYSLMVPYGGQGLYDSYVYCDGEIMRAENIRK